MISKLLASKLTRVKGFNDDVVLNTKLFEENKRGETLDEITIIGVIRRYPYECRNAQQVVADLRRIERSLVTLKHYSGAEVMEDFI